jgi:leader peptidase (prepilin peptidase)/N-methyltransferase
MVVLWALLGWVVGYGLNAIVVELPRSDRLIARPCCPSCGAALALPALSVLSGRHGVCTACANRAVGLTRTLEWPAAGLFAALAWCQGWGLPLLVYSLYVLILLVVLAIDLRHRWVYPIVCYPAVLLGIILTGLLSGSWWLGLLGALAGGALFALLYLIGRLIYRGQEPIGVGDITIAAMIGAMVGAERALPALFLGAVLVAVVSLVLLALRRASTRDFIPYGAGLCLGALGALLAACPVLG